MKIIILAAGQGTRLRPYTNDRPKCMVELKGKPLLHRQLDSLYKSGVVKDDIALATGYLDNALDAPGIKKFKNEKFATTNMVSTLFTAKEFFQKNEDLIISYGDIVYKPEVFDKLITTDGDIVIAADLDWFDLWSLRMNNPLDDAETFKMTDSNKVVELGKKPVSRNDVQAQYIGLIKISACMVEEFVDFYEVMDKANKYDGKDFDNMYMTSLIQHMINYGWDVRAALIKKGWLEVDSVGDLEAYEKMESLP